MSGRKSKVCKYCRGLRAVLYKFVAETHTTIFDGKKAQVLSEIAACPYCG